MKRKVNLVGQNTLTISLPIKWVGKNKIKKGDELEINEEGKILTISSDNYPIKETKSLRLSIKDIFSQRTITIPYIRGYNYLKINFDDIRMLEKIEETLEKTPGFEIVKQDANYVEIKNIFGEDTEEFENVFERLYNVVLVGLQEISSELKSGDFKNTLLLEKLSRDSDKYDIFCRRMMYTKSYSDEIRNFSIYATLKNYEVIGDIFKEYYYFINKNKVPKSSELSNLIERLIYLIKYSHKIYYSKATPEHIIETKKKRDEFRTKYNEIFSGLKSKESIAVIGFINQLFYAINHISEETLYLNSE
ncbi:MAG: hypothetical protein ACLFPQ_03595 [Candidatus Woesearchaeota archaeon]